MKRALSLGAAVLALAVFAAHAAAPPSRPLRADHPLIGAWQITLEDTGCTETWRIDRGGTSLVTSAGEVAETRFSLSDQPSDKGFYKWVDTLVRDNGKKDCSGQVTKAPATSTRYLLLNDAGNRFLMCLSEDTHRCIGPFVKVEGGEI